MVPTSMMSKRGTMDFYKSFYARVFYYKKKQIDKK